MRLLESSLAALFVGLAIGSSVLAQATPHTPATAAQRTGRILGVFDESGSPIEGAEVEDRIGGGTARTQRAGLVGMVQFASQHDSSVVTIRKIGFADTTILVMVGAADTVPTQVFLRHVTALEAIVSNAKETEHLPLYLGDFEERLNDSKASGAKTFTPAELRKRDGERLYNVLLQKSVGEANLHCGRVDIYIDGILFKPDPKDIIPGSAGIPDIAVDDYEAAVYYSAGQIPVQFRRTGAACGALLLYRRHR